MMRPCALCTVTCTGVHPSSEREPAAAQGLGMTISHHLFISLQDLTVQDTTQGLKSFEMFKKKKELTILIFPLPVPSQWLRHNDTETVWESSLALNGNEG